nr:MULTISPECIES: AMP-dependent synthetase and ligase [Paenibacillus]
MTQQTNQASMAYQQLLKQEESNAMQLEQLAQRERHAAQVIQTALQGHQTAIHQLQQISNLAQQMNNSMSYSTSNTEQQYNPINSMGFSNQHRQ